MTITIRECLDSIESLARNENAHYALREIIFLALNLSQNTNLIIGLAPYERSLLSSNLALLDRMMRNEKWYERFVLEEKKAQ